MIETVRQRYLSHFQFSWGERQSWEGARFVVIDTESTGFDAKRDRLVSIGGLAISHGEICLEDSFEVMLPVAYNTASVTVHGITREASEGGLEEPVAVERFLNFVRDSVIVGHHIGHDLGMLNRACAQHFDVELRNLSIDIMDLALRLEAGGHLRRNEPIKAYSLDELCAYFAVTPHDRHTAAGDAFIAAQIFLRLLRIARGCGWTRLGDLSERFEPRG